jgi:two-component system phosphate regulon sensor histidine kinase PhoR
VITKDELGRLGDSLNKLGGEMMRKMSEVERLENVRRDFVANVSHEIKTPLTSIKGYVETLQSGALEDPKLTVRFLEKIERNAARLTALVQDILSLAKIESLEDSFQLGPVEWNEVIHSVVSRCEDAIGQKHLRLKLNIPQAPVYVSGDREAMIQVLDNLLTNAIKYTADGGLITLTLYHKNNWAKIEVEDTGIGIPSEHLPRIFERFYRVDKARSRDLGGTGLGLSIVKHLVSGMGGEVTVTSSVGVGSIFSVRLKVARYQQTSGH